jgi:hypothetical protein
MWAQFSKSKGSMARHLSGVGGGGIVHMGNITFLEKRGDT